MFHVCVRRFDVTDTVESFFELNWALTHKYGSCPVTPERPKLASECGSHQRHRRHGRRRLVLQEWRGVGHISANIKSHMRDWQSNYHIRSNNYLSVSKQFFSEQIFYIAGTIKKLFWNKKKLFWNKFDWITHVGWFVGAVQTQNMKSGVGEPQNPNPAAQSHQWPIYDLPTCCYMGHAFLPVLGFRRHLSIRHGLALCPLPSDAGRRPSSSSLK